MGGECLTLADLWPKNPRAVLVGINPAATSVEVGHYYQGLAGRRMFGMLRDTGILGSPREGHVTGLHDDDLALFQGIGFTDLVKRPTPNARNLERAELDYGARLLEKKLSANASPLVIFVFKKTARTLFGRFEGIGLLKGIEIGGHATLSCPTTERTFRSENQLLQIKRTCGRRLSTRRSTSAQISTAAAGGSTPGAPARSPACLPDPDHQGVDSMRSRSPVSGGCFRASRKGPAPRPRGLVDASAKVRFPQSAGQWKSRATKAVHLD